MRGAVCYKSNDFAHIVLIYAPRHRTPDDRRAD